MRLLLITAIVTLVAFPTFAFAADGQIVVAADGSVVIDGQLVPDTLTVTADGETILVPLHPYLPPGATAGTWSLALPVVMGGEWQPELIANRCACTTELARTDAETFTVSISGLSAGGDVILRAEFPPGTFDLPVLTRFWTSVNQASPWLLGLSLLLLFGSLGLLGWMVRERAEYLKFQFAGSPVTAPPDEIAPALLSLLPSGKITAATLAALLIDLARRGYLTITKTDKTFRLSEERTLDLTGPDFALGAAPNPRISEAERAKAKREGVTIAEKFLLAKLFTAGRTTISRQELTTRFGRHLESAKVGKVYAELYREATSRGYFIQNPHEIHLRYRAVGIAIFFLGVVGLASTLLVGNQPLFVPLIWASVALAGYTITRMVAFLPLLTVAGQAEYARWAGFRTYVRDPKPVAATVPTARFFAYLPYAAAWGVLDDWAARFGDRVVTAPSWYRTEPKQQPARAMAEEIDALTSFIAKLLAAIHEHTTQ